jgi:hypothetical protein
LQESHRATNPDSTSAVRFALSSAAQTRRAQKTANTSPAEINIPPWIDSELINLLAAHIASRDSNRNAGIRDPSSGIEMRDNRELTAGELEFLRLGERA